MSDSKDVAVAKENLPDFMQADMEEYAGAGVSDRAGDAAVPFIVILQKGSPQVNKKDGAYVEGAEPGMLMNNATMELYDAEGDGLMFVPAFYSKKYVEWIPRTAGGGYVATYDRDDEVVAKANPKMIDGKQKGLQMPDSGNDLVETDYYFGIIPGTMMPAIFALSSTALKTSRNWQSLQKAQRVGGKSMPAFANVYRLKTSWQSNDAGDWFSPVVTMAERVEDADLYMMAREFYNQCKTGEVNIGRPDEPSGSGGDQPIDIDGEEAI